MNLTRFFRLSAAVLVGMVLVAPILVRPAARVLSWVATLLFPSEGNLAARNAERPIDAIRAQPPVLLCAELGNRQNSRDMPGRRGAR